MSAETTIEWTDRTWNPVRGCSLVSPGCLNCYAMRTAHRFSGAGAPYAGLTKLGNRGPTWTGEVRLVPEALSEPLRWRKSQRVFVNSMSDLFHEGVDFGFVGRVFDTMARCPQHTFQILTKRPERMREFFGSASGRLHAMHPDGTPLPNVWLGVSVEDQEHADERIPHLLHTPAAVRFLSCEPLLGPVDLTRYLVTDYGDIDWVIVGGESGPGARPMHLEWARSLVAQCRSTGVACFVKQLGARPAWDGRIAEWPTTVDIEGDKKNSPDALPGENIFFARLESSKGGDMAEWPEDLRVREWPRKTEEGR